MVDSENAGGEKMDHDKEKVNTSVKPDVEMVLDKYSISELAFRIGEAAVTGMLYEVSTSPSPGLVSPFSNGIHHDMDFFTFLRSTSSITHAMALCAQVGIDHYNQHNSKYDSNKNANCNDDNYYIELLAKIRQVGIKAERHMLKVTGGINTQRGILFAAGVVSAAAGVISATEAVGAICEVNKIDSVNVGTLAGVEGTSQGKNISKSNDNNIGTYERCYAGKCPTLNRYSISEECKRITHNIVENELKNISMKDNKTNGEKVYLKYGISGIRGELEGGLQSALMVGLPFYENAMHKGLSLPKALAHSLIGLMSIVDDTVVINRSGIEGLNFMRERASNAIKLGGMLTEQGEKFISIMEKEFVHRNISPGGAADLLAISVMLRELEKIEI
jgi:triphosphoribosyl-dephospho-CoA synthetase